MGNELFKEVMDLTGLPTNMISEELGSVLGQVGTTPHAVTIEDLRKAVAMYLAEVMGSEDIAEMSHEPDSSPIVPSGASETE